MSGPIRENAFQRSPARFGHCWASAGRATGGAPGGPQRRSVADELESLAIARALPVLEGLHRLSKQCFTRLSTLQWKLHVRRLGLTYQGSSDDIFIVSYPKSGTTLMQMLVYQLLTDGVVRFNHISEFSPSFEHLPPPRAPGIDAISARPRPHVIKSHLEHALIPRGPGRYIYIMRNGLDVAVSLYHQAGRGAAPRMPFKAFFEAMLQGNLPAGSWTEHVAGWVGNSKSLNVLYVTYEDLIRDLPTQARRVAEFCGVPVQEADWARVHANCSFEYMREHEKKFDGWLRWNVNAADMRFIRKGVVGGWRDLVDSTLLARFQTQYDTRLGGLALPNHLRGEGEAIKG